MIHSHHHEASNNSDSESNPSRPSLLEVFLLGYALEFCSRNRILRSFAALHLAKCCAAIWSHEKRRRLRGTRRSRACPRSVDTEHRLTRASLLPPETQAVLRRQ